MTETLVYKNTTGATGSSIQADVEVAGVSQLLSAGDITSVVLKITWSPQSDWQNSDCYVYDPDYNQHDLFYSGTLPSGSGQRTDSFTVVSSSFPSTMEGTWEFYLDNQMYGSNTLDNVVVEVLVTSTKMPTTYGESVWWNGKAYAGGIDLSTNAGHIYPQNGATIVADTGSGGAYAYSFDGVDDVWSDDGNSTMSVSAWLKHDGTSGKQMIVCNHGGYKGNWQLYRNGDELGMYMGFFAYPASGSASLTINVSSVLPTSATWYHVAAIFDGSLTEADRIKLYVDGVQVSGTTVPNPTHGGLTTVPNATVVGPLPPQAIGGMVEVSTYGTPTGTIYFPFDGLVDDARAWPNTVLSAADLTWLASGRGVAGGPSSSSFKPYLPALSSTIVGFPNA